MNIIKRYAIIIITMLGISCYPARSGKLPPVEGTINLRSSPQGEVTIESQTSSTQREVVASSYSRQENCPQDRKTKKAPEDIYLLENPFTSQEDIAEGEAIYQGTKKVPGIAVACAMCHGRGGKGDGPASRGGSKGPSVYPRNFTCKETMKDITPGQMFWIIKNGSPGTGMTAQKASDLIIWQLVAYIESAFVKR